MLPNSLLRPWWHWWFPAPLTEAEQVVGAVRVCQPDIVVVHLGGDPGEPGTWYFQRIAPPRREVWLQPAPSGDYPFTIGLTGCESEDVHVIADRSAAIALVDLLLDVDAAP